MKKYNYLHRGWQFLKESFLKFTYNSKNQEPVFILGCGHSGTTLMLRILANHKDLYGVPYESRIFIGNYVNHSLIKKWNKIVRQGGYKKWVEKTPRHVQYLDRILHVFPKAKILVMYRDGRDVAVSLRKRTGNSLEAIERWINHNEEALRFQEDKRFLFVKLEELTQDPEIILQKICKHINCKYSKELLSYDNEKFLFQKTEPLQAAVTKGKNHLGNRVWQINQPIFKSTSRWKEEATSYELKEFESNLEFRKMMDVLGYQ